jgi:hypothetical protein
MVMTIIITTESGDFEGPETGYDPVEAVFLYLSFLLVHLRGRCCSPTRGDWTLPSRLVLFGAVALRERWDLIMEISRLYDVK